MNKITDCLAQRVVTRPGQVWETASTSWWRSGGQTTGAAWVERLRITREFSTIERRTFSAIGRRTFSTIGRRTFSAIGRRTFSAIGRRTFSTIGRRTIVA